MVNEVKQAIEGVVSDNGCNCIIYERHEYYWMFNYITVVLDPELLEGKEEAEVVGKDIISRIPDFDGRLTLKLEPEFTRVSNRHNYWMIDCAFDKDFENDNGYLRICILPNPKLINFTGDFVSGLRVIKERIINSFNNSRKNFLC